MGKVDLALEPALRPTRRVRPTGEPGVVGRANSPSEPWSKWVSPLVVATLTLVTGCGHHERPVPSLGSNAVIVAFGDSLTYGTGADSEHAYPAVLAKLSGRRVINAGMPGERTGEAMARLPGVLRQHAPDLVILCHGGNDMLQNVAKETLRSNLESLIKTIRASGADVLLVGVPNPSLMLKTAPVYEEIAEAGHLPYEHDIVANVLKERTLRSDYVHPNAEGYALIAQTLADHLPSSR